MVKLYNKYRFSSFDEIIGDLAFVKKIKKDIETASIDHTYMLYGERGTGKTSIARLIASHIPNCFIEEISASVTNGIEKSKEIASTINSVPIGYKNRMIILDEAQRGTSGFFNALLKVLEEPPNNIYFCLCTTQEDKIPNDIKSRFTLIKCISPDLKSMRDHLFTICEKEDIKTNRRVLTKICNKNSNIPRDCIGSLELIKGIESIDEQLLLLEGESVQEASGYEIAKALNNSDFITITGILKGIKEEEVEGIRRVILNYFTKVLLETNGKTIEGKRKQQQAALILESFGKEFPSPGRPSLVLACYENS